MGYLSEVMVEAVAEVVEPLELVDGESPRVMYPSHEWRLYSLHTMHTHTLHLWLKFGGPIGLCLWVQWADQSAYERWSPRTSR